MTSTSIRVLVLGSLLTASACGSREPLDPQARAPSGESAVEPAPPVKECLLRALGDPEREALFAHESVEIAAARQPDGSVRVAFSLPVSQIIVGDGRLKTKLEDETIFTARSASHVRRYTHAPGDPPGEKSPSSFGSLARAVQAVCGQLSEAEAMEFAVRVSEKPDGFSVLVTRIPYTPGGHTLYRLSRDFEIVDVMPGS